MKPGDAAGPWSFEDTARAAAERALAASIEQRLDWLEEMLAVARESGALAREVDRRRRERGLPPLASVSAAAGPMKRLDG